MIYTVSIHSLPKKPLKLKFSHEFLTAKRRAGEVLVGMAAGTIPAASELILQAHWNRDHESTSHSLTPVPAGPEYFIVGNPFGWF